MSLLYKKPEDIIYKVDITMIKDKIQFEFYSDCGKHATFEILDKYLLSPKKLLDILQEHEDYVDEELA
jgi:hypothetical protein